MGCPGFQDFIDGDGDEDGEYSENKIGAVAIYDRDDPEFPLLITYDEEVNAEFGTSVAINDAGIIAVGTKIGIVELYNMKARPPNQSFRTEGDDQREDNFGWSVALSDDNWLAVGAIDHDNGNGAVFLWRDITDLNEFPEEIPAPAAATQNCEGDCEFGYSVAFSGKNLVVGSPYTEKGGRAFVYDLTLDDYNDKVQTLPTNPEDYPPDFSEFGFSVAMTDEAVVVGSRKYTM